MKTARIIAVLALSLYGSGHCFADWEVEQVNKVRAKELGMEIQSKEAGSNQVRFELEFKPEGSLKNFSRVDLRLGESNTTLLTAALQEDRSRPGHIVVSFAADRTQLDRISLRVMVPESLGGTAYELRLKNFVESK